MRITGVEGIYVFVNGRRYLGNPARLTLDDRAVIELQVGTGPFEPLPYTFPTNL
jgi:hypothetical protein